MSGYSQQDTDMCMPIPATMPSIFSPSISDRDGVPTVEEIVKAENECDVTREKKRQFAIELAKDPAEPWEAARRVAPHNTSHVVYMYENWPNDPEIKAYIAAVHSVVGIAGQLPTSEEYALNLWKLAKNAKDDEIRLKYLRLYAETMGELKRPTGDGGGIVINQNKVMVVEHLGDDANYEKVALAQQRNLHDKLIKVIENYEEVEDDE